MPVMMTSSAFSRPSRGATRRPTFRPARVIFLLEIGTRRQFAHGLRGQRVRAVVVRWKGRTWFELAGQNAVIKRHAGDNTDVFLLRERQNFFFHFKAECVVSK